MKKNINLENSIQQDIAREKANKLASEFGLYSNKSVKYVMPIQLNYNQNIIQLRNGNLKASLLKSNLN